MPAAIGWHDLRRRKRGDTKRPEKITFNVGGVPFELDPKYTPLQVLGLGSYGVVCSCLNRETNQVVAIKKIGNALSDNITALRTLREIQILRQMNHENIISLNDVMVSSSVGGKSDFKQVYMVQELMDCDLGRIIKSKLSRDHCKYFLFQILRGLKYLHSANVVHRDLKPQNILLNKKFDLKICDFGLARTKYQDAQVMTEYVVTRWYRAPELILGCNSYGSEIDMWSVGCIFAEMLGGFPIFRGDDWSRQIVQIHIALGTQTDLSFIRCERARRFVSELPYSPGVCFEWLYYDADPLAVDLLTKMLIFNPSKRISAMEALEHPYFLGLNDQVMDHSAPIAVKLEIDEKPDQVDANTLRELIWKEMLLFHPEQQS